MFPPEESYLSSPHVASDATGASSRDDAEPWALSHITEHGTVHVAIHDALNASDRRFCPYTFDGQAEPGASPEAAVAAAARDVLMPFISQLPLDLVSQACIDAGVASVDADYTAALAALPDDQARAQGIAVGQAAAVAILALRAADGAVGPFLDFNCPQDTKPGEYQCTPGVPFIAF